MGFTIRPDGSIVWGVVTYSDLTRRRCQQCGEVFIIASDHDRARYCSEKCRQAAHRARQPGKPEAARCAWCSSSMKNVAGAGRPRRYCSHRCRQAAYRARNREKP